MANRTPNLLLRENRPKVRALRLRRSLSLVRFANKNRELARIRADSRETTSGFLCIADCVAEGEGFELSVRFCHGKPRHVRKLQIAKPYQRISRQNPTSGLCMATKTPRRLSAANGDTVTTAVFKTKTQADNHNSICFGGRRWGAHLRRNERVNSFANRESLSVLIITHVSKRNDMSEIGFTTIPLALKPAA